MKSRKAQKGSGLLDWFRGLRGTRKVAAEPEPRTINIKDESYSDALKRTYVFFYYKLRGEEPPKAQRFLTPAQEAEVRTTLIRLDNEGKSTDEIAREALHTEPSVLQKELEAWEKYHPDKYLNKNTPYQRLAFPIAKSLGRFLATIRKSPQNIQYTSNVMVHSCESTDQTQVVKTLSDDYCFSVITPDNREAYEVGKGYTYAPSYIMIKPEFFPKGATAGGPVVLIAKRLPTVSFLLEAFRQKGVLEIEPSLKAVLEKEAPELLQFGSQDPITIIVPYYLTDASTTRDRFIVMDPVFFGRGRNVLNRKSITKSGLIVDAFTKRKVFFMDPKTMVEIRNFYPQLWLANYGPNNSKVYKTLTPHEKVAFCFLQYTKFMEIYSQNRNALPTNNASSTARKTLNAVTLAKKQVFDANYEKGGNPYELADNFEAEDVDNLDQLKKLQQDLLNTVEIQTPDQVRRLLAKFDRRATSAFSAVPNYFGPTALNRPANVAPTQTRNRRMRVREMLLPVNLSKDRAALVQKVQNAMKTPVKSSILPNFMRSRKAKNQNKQAYVGRIEAAKRELYNFNIAHGLASPMSSYGYNFTS